LSREGPQRTAYVTKVFPRFSETFIVTELLAHERAGADLEIVSLRPPVGGRLHPALGRLRAPIAYLPAHGIEAADLWAAMRRVPAALAVLDEEAPGADARDALQGLLLAEWLGERRIEHVHAHFANCATTVARIASALTGIPFTVTAHAKDIFHEDVDRDVLRSDLEAAAAVATVSRFNATHLRAVAPAARVEAIYNGLDLAGFPYRDPADRPPRVAAVGRLVEKKGFDVLIDACALLRDRGVRFACEIAGEGPHAERLAARIAAHGLEDHVRLLGARAQHEVVALLREAAVLAAPCVVGADGNRDGLPTVLLEAMALGTACVSTPVTGIPEAIEHGRTGLLVPERDAAALAAALERLLGDVALRRDLAAAARARVEARFDSDRNAAALRALWASCRAATLLAA